MSLASESIADLDAELREAGQDVELRRPVAGGDALVRPGIRAFVRGYNPQELTGGIQQGDVLVVLSPTGMPAPFASDPIRPGDRIDIAGRSFRVAFANPVKVGGTTVRINAAVRG